jgi:hypothetical protein
MLWGQNVKSKKQKIIRLEGRMGVFCVDTEVISSICKILRDVWNSCQFCSIMMAFESQKNKNVKSKKTKFLHIIVSCTKLIEHRRMVKNEV